MRNIAHKITGDDLTADEFNDIPSELENLILSTQQTLTAADLTQSGKAVATYAACGDFYSDSGVADAYVLTQPSPRQSVTQYWDGMRVRFIPGNTNTTASTINVAGLGVKDITKPDGSPLEAGQIVADEIIELHYSLADDSFLISTVIQQATETTSGIAKVATQELVTAGTDDETFITPKKLKDHIKMRLIAGQNTNEAGTKLCGVGLSVTKGATGVYNYTFDTPLADTNYVVDINVYDSTHGTASFSIPDNEGIGNAVVCGATLSNITTSGFTVTTKSSSASTENIGGHSFTIDAPVITDVEHAVLIYSL